MDTRKNPPVYDELLPPNDKYSIIVFKGVCRIRKRVSKKILNNALRLGVFNWVEERTGKSKLAWVNIYQAAEISTCLFRKGLYNNFVAKLRERGLL